MIISKRMKQIGGVVGIISVISLGLLFIILQKSPKKLTSLKEIVPGETSEAQINTIPNQYGRTNSGASNNYFFGNNAPQQYSQVITQAEKVVAIKKTNPQEFEYRSLREFEAAHGKANTIEDSDWSEFGFEAFIYTKLGKIIIANPNSSEILQEWDIPKNLDQKTIHNLLNSEPETQGS